ncbi:hypothetical protein [Pectinatus sottacetonis]|uniref:hypothetical protein n=1 Tax=Pectinatus sottacetonis TaxID=1002795 RepID=UPI0018C5D206|nr:hypothetical protein [Pectinatus sottacetonis]
MRYPIGIIKFFAQEEWRKDFLNGKIYFKASGYFRELEDTYRGDKYDGQKPIDIKLSKISIMKDNKVVIPNDKLLNMTFGFNGDDKIPICCASSVDYDILNIENNMYKFKEDFINKMAQFGKYIAYVPIMAHLSRQKSNDFIMNLKPWHSLSALLDSTA